MYVSTKSRNAQNSFSDEYITSDIAQNCAIAAARGGGGGTRGSPGRRGEGGGRETSGVSPPITNGSFPWIDTPDTKNDWAGGELSRMSEL